MTGRWQGFPGCLHTQIRGTGLRPWLFWSLGDRTGWREFSLVAYYSPGFCGRAHQKRLLSPLHPVHPLLLSQFNSKQLPVAHIIVPLSRRKLPGKESTEDCPAPTPEASTSTINWSFGSDKDSMKTWFLGTWGHGEGLQQSFSSWWRICKAGEPLQLLSVCGNRPIRDSTDRSRVHLDAPRCHNESQEGNSLLMKLSFLSFHKKLILQQPVKNPSDMLHRLLLRLGKNLNVVQVYKNKLV